MDCCSIASANVEARFPAGANLYKNRGDAGDSSAFLSPTHIFLVRQANGANNDEFSWKNYLNTVNSHPYIYIYTVLLVLIRVVNWSEQILNNITIILEISQYFLARLVTLAMSTKHKTFSPKNHLEIDTVDKITWIF